MFTRNEGTLDRIIRVTLGLVLLPAGLFLLGGLQGHVPGLVVAGLGALGLLTGFTGFCLLYVPLGINTLEKEREFIARLKSTASTQMERCMSMMAGFSQAPVDQGFPNVAQMCGPCSPSTPESREQQE